MLVINQNDFAFLAIGIYILYKCIDVFVNLELYKRCNLVREFVKFTFVIYMLYLVSKVYFPITLGFGQYLEFHMPVIALNPLEMIKSMYYAGGLEYAVFLLVANFIMLAPLGFYLCYFMRRRMNSPRKVFIAGLKVSIFIECTQVLLSLMIPNTFRFFEINDLILNSVGCIMGYYIFKFYYIYFEVKILKNSYIRNLLVKK